MTKTKNLHLPIHTQILVQLLEWFTVDKMFSYSVIGMEKLYMLKYTVLAPDMKYFGKIFFFFHSTKLVQLRVYSGNLHWNKMYSTHWKSPSFLPLLAMKNLPNVCVFPTYIHTTALWKLIRLVKDDECTTVLDDEI